MVEEYDTQKVLIVDDVKEAFRSMFTDPMYWRRVVPTVELKLKMRRRQSS
jgi:hypothetical protein